MNPLPLCAAAHHPDIKSNFKVATWNVRTLNDACNTGARAEELINCLEKQGIDICCLTEVRWPGTGIKKINGWTIAFSGRDDGLGGRE